MTTKQTLLEAVEHKAQPINFPCLDEASFEPGILALIEQLKAAVQAVTSNTAEATWANTVDPLDDASERLNFAWTIISHLNSVADTPTLRAIVNALLPPISLVYSEIGQNEKLYARYKAIRDSQAFATLSPARRRIIEREILGFVLSGAELDEAGKKQMTEINEAASAASQKFSENLLDCTNDYELLIKPEEASRLAGLPESDKALFAQQAANVGKKGFRITLHMPSYLPVMQYATDRNLRETLYRAYVTRASQLSPAGKDNAPLMDELLALRAKEASLLGKRNYAEVSLATKMADSPEQVKQFLRDIAAKAKPAAQRDLAELIEFARTQLNIADPQAWDLAFISEKLRQAKYAYSEQEVREYFTLPTVLSGLFALTERLFSVTIEECVAPVWHPDVRYWVMRDRQGQEIASFYTDLYAREGKRGGAWMNDQRSRRSLDGQIQTPIAYLTCNFAAPVGQDPSLLTLNDVQTIFHEFGHGLHHMLTRQTDLSVSGIAGVEWDAVEMPSQFMENFVLNWDVMQTITRHVKTGQTMPRALFDKLEAAKNFQAGMANLRQIEFALFDMRLHSDFDASSNTIEGLLDEVRAEVAVVFPPKFNRFANSFSHIFAGGYAAGYYSYKWAEVLSADAFALFQENGVFDPATGQRWLDEVLSQGGARSAAESFRAFRGRDPEPEALLRQYGLIED